MPETPLPPDDELQRLRERARKLAQEKSYLQLIIQMMNRLSGAPGLENTIESMLRCVVDVIGGSNIELYYTVGNDLLYADVFGARRKIDTIEDAAVKNVFETRSPVEIERDFSESQLATPEFTKAYTWVFPLVVGPDLVGVIKIQNVVIEMRPLAEHLPAFVNYAAAILKNEILGHTRLEQAYDQLSRANAELTSEVAQRTRAEEALRGANEELEARVAERAASLRIANKQLQIELTERRRAEEALKQQWSTLRGIIDSTSAAIFSVDRRYRYTSFNARHAAVMKAIYGAEIEIGRSLLDSMTVADDREEARTNIDRALAGEQVVESAFSGEELRSRLFFEVLHSPIRADGAVIGVAVVASDITERKRAEEALKKSEERLRLEVSRMPIGYVVWDKDFRVVTWNPAAEEIFGFTFDEAEGRHSYELIVPPEAQPHVDDIWRRLLAGDASAHSVNENQTRDGRTIVCEWTNTPLKQPDGTVLGVMSMVQDITERVRAEREIARVNRALRMLSDTNQALIHITDEATLLSEVCRIAVDAGGYRMALVGFAEHDEAKSVRPVAHAGVDSGYIESAHVSWADDERGRGPGGTAIRTRQPCIARSIPSDTAFAPWWDAAIQRGYKSIIALPLMSEGQTLGALTICAGEEDAFDSREEEILKELADDLAFGITALRTRARRDQSEEALHKREAELNESQRLAHIGGWDWDEAKDTIWWSAEYYRIYGVDPNQPTPNYTQHLNAYTAESAQRLDALVKRAMETGEPYEVDLELAHPRAATRWIVARGEAKRDAKGMICGLRGTAQNVTERKRAEQEILRLDRTYRVLSRTNEMIIRTRDRREIFDETCRIAIECGSFVMAWVGVADEKTHFVRPVASYGNAGAYLQTVRISANDVPEGRGPTGIAMREGRHVICRDIEHEPSMAPWCQAALEMGYRSCAAFPIHTGGRTVATFTVYSREAGWFADEEIRLLDELASDISYALESLEKEDRRLLAEQALRESEERFRSFVERAVVGIYRSTPDGRFLMANAALARMLGFPSVEALLAENVENWASRSGYDRTVFKELLEREGSATDFQGTYTAAGGAIVSLRESARAIRDERGEISYYEGIIEDMTAQKALEAQLLQAQKMETVGLLAGGIAHDFNNVLQALLSLSEALRVQIDQPARFAATAADLHGQIKRGAALTRQLLLFSRREAPRLDRLDLNDVVQQLARMIRRLLRENILLSLDLADGPIPLEADSGQLEQVLMNLVINAGDAMPDGGRLVIRTRLVNADATMEVIDTGTGISEEVRARIFEPFFTTKAASKGTGLGLAVVHGIVANHGGRIDVESEVGRGTTFRVVLPALVVAEGGAAAPAPEEGKELPEGAGERVLLVEDEEGAREGLTELIRMLGYEVTAVGSRAEAIAVPSQPGFDLLLTDLMLPDVMGTDLAKELQHRWPELRILLMSGYTEDLELRQQISRGELGFLQKPFDLDVLARELRAALDAQPKSLTR
jgi:PAS domain S-box-containing protein